MLKKAAFVVAGAAATLVAASPLAFATTGSTTGIDKSGAGLINVSGNDVNVPIQACNNDVPINGGVGAVQGNVKDIVAGLTGAAGILGKASASSSVVTDTDRSCGLESGAGDVVS